MSTLAPTRTRWHHGIATSLFFLAQLEGIAQETLVTHPETTILPASPALTEEQVAPTVHDAIRLRQMAIAHRENSLAAREADIRRREVAVDRREEAVHVREVVASRREEAVGYWEDVPEAERPEWPAPSIVGKYAAVIDVRTGALLHEKKGDTKTAVASTQKLLTALLVLERGGLDGLVEITQADANVSPTRIGVKAGQKYTRRQLVQSLLVRSGNDIAHALARDHSGSEEAFAEAMTARAQQLGMVNSTFKNPHGLTESGQHSTAEDIAIVAREARKHPFICECVATKECVFQFTDGSTRQLYNTNKLLKSYPGCTGMKTGFTNASGNCLVTSAKKGDREVIVVVLGSTSTWVTKDSAVLLDWALGAEH